MENKGIIELEGMEFHAFHGCLESERLSGNLFTVDFRGEAPMGAASHSDSLADAVDYGRIYAVIAREMAVRSDLLEHVAGRIVRALETELPELSGFSVRVSKQRPPVGGVCRWSRIIMHGGKWKAE